MTPSDRQRLVTLGLAPCEAFRRDLDLSPTQMERVEAAVSGGVCAGVAVGMARKGRGVMSLLELLARISAAEGPDREIDAELWDLEDPRPRVDLDGTGAFFKRDPDDHIAFDLPPAYTASLDAALALCERVLPYFTVDLTIYRTNGGEFRPSSTARLFCPYGGIQEHRGKAPTPALALLAAILRAKLAQEPTP